jgi:hypothetical protein
MTAPNASHGVFRTTQFILPTSTDSPFLTRIPTAPLRTAAPGGIRTDSTLPAENRPVLHRLADASIDAISRVDTSPLDTRSVTDRNLSLFCKYACQR